MKRPANWFIILLLGALSLITPFSVDMYLPAFARIAAEFHTTTSAISWSLSTYFIGFALGQILYGPLLDRFGRKRPIYVGIPLPGCISWLHSSGQPEDAHFAALRAGDWRMRGSGRGGSHGS